MKSATVKGGKRVWADDRVRFTIPFYGRPSVPEYVGVGTIASIRRSGARGVFLNLRDVTYDPPIPYATTWRTIAAGDATLIEEEE